MVRVTDGYEELGIAPDASHILRWTRSRPFEAAGVRNPRLRLQDFLKDDLVLPPVAKVILVDDPGCVLARVDIAEADAILVLDLHIEVVVRGFPKVPPVHDELVKMGIPPVHDDLKDFVKFTQRAIRHLNPPPYRRVALIQRHLELIDGTSLVNRLAFLHEVLHHEVCKEVADLVEDGVQPLPVSVWDIDERGVDLIAQLLQFLLRELNELLILGCLLDPGLEPHRKSSCLHHRFPLLHGQLERELFVGLLPVLGWHDSSSISRSPGRHPYLNPVLWSSLKKLLDVLGRRGHRFGFDSGNRRWRRRVGLRSHGIRGPPCQGSPPKSDHRRPPSETASLDQWAWAFFMLLSRSAIKGDDHVEWVAQVRPDESFTRS